MLLEGKTAIVTPRAAEAEIGKACLPSLLTKEGAAVAVHFHGNEEKASSCKKRN